MGKMSKRPPKLQLPLRNITSSINSVHCSNMSYSNDSGFSNLTNSPMSTLAINLSELSTGRTTPRRRLSLSSVDTPPNECLILGTERTFSAESGCFSGSPFDGSPTLESLSAKRFTLHPDIPLEALSVKKKTIAFRRISSQPLPTLKYDCDSPTEFLDEDKNDKNEAGSEEEWTKAESRLFSDEISSEDSGLGMDHERKSNSLTSFDDLVTSSSSCGSSSQTGLPSLDEVWTTMESHDFKAPKGKPPKRSRSAVEDRVFNEDTCSPIKYSPVKSSMPKPSFFGSLFSEESENCPSKAKQVATEARKSSVDDGFQELFHIEDLQNKADDQISSLMSATLLHRPKGDNPRPRHNDCNKQVKFLMDRTPSSQPGTSRWYLQRSISLDIRPRSNFKRSEPPQDLSHCVQNNKRWRGEGEGDSDHSDVPNLRSSSSDLHSMDIASTSNFPCVRLHRCHSETEAMIKSAVSKLSQEPDLIGDSSKPYCLPTIEGKHQDLKSISAETLSELIEHEFDGVVEEFHVIDCRYPYEYEGGHIKNAANIYTKDGVIDKYLKSPITVKDVSKRLILIFHCEFSSERGPGLSRFLRRHDRKSNKECYPFLHYPEIYLLEGGYKNFFEKFDNLCEPRTYRKMNDKNHAEDMRKFRAKSKSWAGERSGARTGMRNLKF